MGSVMSIDFSVGHKAMSKSENAMLTRLSLALL